MSDRIIRGIAGNNQVRFLGVDCLDTVKEAQSVHNLSISTSVLVGRLLAAGLMMGIEHKSEKETVTVKINGNGIVKTVIVTSNNQGQVKAYINNGQAELPLSESGRIDVGGLLEKGNLTVIRDLGERQPYSGTIELKNGEVATDLSYYYSQSEQVPTAVGLGVLVEAQGEIRQAGGFIVQLMPETDEDVIEKLEKNLADLPNLTDLLDMGYQIEKILEEMVLADLAPRVMKTIPASYHCDCSQAKFEQGLRLLDKQELEEYLRKGEEVKVKCHFCNTEYHYGKASIEKILNEDK